jgi:hypothetical protein
VATLYSRAWNTCIKMCNYKPKSLHRTSYSFNFLNF